MPRISSWTSCGLAGEQLVELGVAHHLRVVLEDRRRPAAARRAASTLLDSALFVKAIESVASMIAPAKASPNDRPKDPVAELTPAASPTRSSEIGASV